MYVILRFVGSMYSLHIASDLHSEIQDINNRALPISFHSRVAVQQNSYSTEMRTDGYH